MTDFVDPATAETASVPASADDNARTTDDLSIPPFLDRTAEAPTPQQLAEAYDRAAKLGLRVRGRKNFVLDDGKHRQQCGDFVSLMFNIEWREANANGQPTYIESPCGAFRTEFLNDANGTSFFAEHQGDGTYKRINGSKTDPTTGETIQFDVLGDGSHKETRRWPKEDDETFEDETAATSAAVLTLARRVKALIEKGDRAAEKAEQFYKAAGIHIKEIKEQSEDWETIVRERCGLGRSRAYELMAIADGKTTLEKLRERSNTSSRVSHAKKSAEQRTAAPAVARATGSDEIDVVQRREQMAELDQSGEKTVDDVDRRVSCVFNTILRHVKGLSRCETERFLAVLGDQIDNIERDLRDVIALAEAAS
jgi:hypothetical protein